MKCAVAAVAVSLACGLAAHAHAQAEKPWPQAPGRIESVAGGEITLEFGLALDGLNADIGPDPAVCALDASRKRATCRVPTTLGPGLWPVDVEYRVVGQYFRQRSILELRVPAIVSATPVWVRPGATIELELEAPLPNDEPVELLVRGGDFEAVVAAQQLRPARLRARLPNGELPQAPILQLRVRDMESPPYAGIVFNRWVSLARSYADWFAPGLLVGALVAVAIVAAQPARRRAA